MNSTRIILKTTTPSEPIKKTILVLLDIDETLINFNNGASTDTVVWYGGSNTVWQIILTDLKDKLKAQGLDVQFHVITFKSEYRNEQCKIIGLRGDQLSAAVTEDARYIEIYKGYGGIYKDGGLKKILDPENPIIFTNKQCKIQNGIKALQKNLEVKRNVSVKNADCWVVDDDEDKVCTPAIKEGYRACSAKNLRHLQHCSTIKNEQLIEKEQAEILNIFTPIYQAYKLELPTLALFDTREQVLEAKIDYLKAAVPAGNTPEIKSQLNASKDPGDKHYTVVPTAKITMTQFLSQPNRVSLPTLEQLQLQGIKGLDDDDAEKNQSSKLTC